MQAPQQRSDGGLKDPLDDEAFKAAHPNCDCQLDGQSDELARDMLGRSNSPRPTPDAGGRRNRMHQLEAGEAKAGRCDLKSVAATNDDARNQRVHVNMRDARAHLEFALQDREIGIAPLPSGDFDANSVRRQMDDNRACRCVQGLLPGPAGFQGSVRVTLHAPEEIMMRKRGLLAAGGTLLPWPDGVKT
jgi:hypothetical protein